MASRKPVECTARFEQLRFLTPDVAEIVLHLETPETLPFRPGQFLNLSIPREGARPLIRAYSLACRPEGGSHLTLCVDTDVPGPGVSYLLELKPGDRVQFKAPLGNFVLKDPLPDRPVFIITHISALGMCRYLAEAAFEEMPSRPVTLIAELKSEQGLFYHEALLELSRRYPAFRHVLTCPGASEAWTGPRRPLLEEALRRLPSPPEVDAYVCGLGSMVATVKETLKKAGVPANRIVSEKWSRSEGGEEEGG